MLTTTTLGTLAIVIAVLGVISRLLVRSRPLHHLIPAAYRWIPDAIAAGVGVLLLGLPEATTTLGIVECVGMALLAGALAVAPGATTPHEGGQS